VTCSPLLPKHARMRGKMRLVPPFGVALVLSTLSLFCILEGFGECKSAGEKEARAVLNEARYLYHRNQTEEAEILLRRAIDLLEPEEISDQPSTDSLASLLEQKEKRVSCATALMGLASVLEQKGEYGEAEGLLRQALDNLESLPIPPLDQITGVLDQLAGLLEKQGRLAEANEVLLQVLSNLGRMEQENDSQMSLVRKRRERVLQKAGVLENQLRDAIKRYEQVFGPDHFYVGRGVYHLALLMEEKGNDQEAEAHYKRALEIHEGFLGPEHPAIATFYVHLAQIYRSRGHFGEAQTFLKKALTIFEDALRETEPERMEALKGMVLKARLNEDTTPYLQSIIEADRSNFGPSHPKVAGSMRYLALYLESQGNYVEAQNTLEQALAILRKNLGADHPDVILTMQKRAGLFDAMGKHEEAIRVSEEILEIQRGRQGSDDWTTAKTLYHLGLYCSRNGDLDRSDEYFRKTLTVHEASLGSEHEFIATILDRLAENCIDRGRPQEAEPLTRRAKEIRQRTLPPPAVSELKPCQLRRADRAQSERDDSSGRGLSGIK
jgi:tetratricopeptide (TPR) repeat protein